MAKFMLLGLFDNVTTAATVVGEVRDLGIKDSEMEIMSNIPYASKIFGRKTPRQWFLPFALGGMVTGMSPESASWSAIRCHACSTVRPSGMVSE